MTAAPPFLTLTQLAQYANGDLVVRDIPSAPAAREALLTSGIDSVTLDTRTLEPGALFVPLRGAKADGHDYLSRAFERGAAAALCARDYHARIQGREPGPLIVVEDVTLGLQRLAHRARERWPGLLIGVTGSAGKTTTKDLVAAVLATRWSTLKTEGNLNNFWGVPLTLLRLRPAHQAAVVEMGMSEPGEIADLAAISRPNAAIITNAGSAHLERFGTVDRVAREKASLARALSPRDVAFVGADSAPLMAALEGVACRLVRYGLATGADLTPERVTPLGAAGSRVEVPGFPAFTLALLGRHQVANALAALAVARELGLDPAAVVAALEAYRPAKARMQLAHAGGATLLVDCYNANPDSTRAALATLAEFPGAARRIAILGDMLELGEAAGRLHHETGAAVRDAELWVVGGFASDTARGARSAGAVVREFDDIAAVRAALAGALAPGTVVLLKASRGAALERALEGLALED